MMPPSDKSQDGVASTALPASIEAIRQLIRDRKITKELFETAEFQSVWEKIPRCLESRTPEVVWASLSTLGHFAAVSKPAERLAQPLIEGRLASELPVMIRPTDGDERYYLAKSMEYGADPKIGELAFRELAEEETAETARRVWAGIAGQNVSSLSEFLSRLNREIKAVRREHDLSADAVCRRLRRINDAVDDFLASADCDAGEEVGEHLRNFYCGHVPRSGPEDRELRDDTSGEFLASLKKIVRLNFSARMDPETYKVVAGIGKWWGAASPSESFETSARQIVRLGTQSLLTYAKQGVKNKPLRQALVEALSEKAVEGLAREFAANSNIGDANVAYWFAHGAEPMETRPIRAVSAISEAKLDEYVARLLIALEQIDSRKSILEQALSDVSDILPVEGETISSAFQRVTQVAQWARAVARSRQIEISPSRSEIVSFDPSAHDGPANTKVGAEIRVLTPGAIKNVQGDVKVVLVKAGVEQIRG